MYKTVPLARIIENFIKFEVARSKFDSKNIFERMLCKT